MKALIFIIIFAIFIIDNSFAQQAACDYKVEILANNSEFESRDFNWRIKATKIDGVPTNITGTAEIQGQNGRILKKYKLWANESISKQKTSSVYSPNLNPGEYKLISKINVVCDDINNDNNLDEKIIKIIEHKEINAITRNNNSIIENDTKINEISKNDTINPIITDKKIENKTMAKNETEKPIVNEEDNVIQLRNGDNKKPENEMTARVVQKLEIAYESSNEKAKNLIFISLLILSVLLNIILIWKR